MSHAIAPCLDIFYHLDHLGLAVTTQRSSLITRVVCPHRYRHCPGRGGTGVRYDTAALVGSYSVWVEAHDLGGGGTAVLV